MTTIRCAVNPLIGRETWFPQKSVGESRQTVKKVVLVGGGTLANAVKMGFSIAMEI
jgi:hypothetical protein